MTLLNLIYIMTLWTVVSSAIQIASFSGLPMHIQTAHIWSYLHWTERIQISEWSTSYHELILDIYPSEHVYQTAFYKLRLYISSLKQPIQISKILPRFSREMGKLWWMSPNRCDREMILFWSEKLFVDIIRVNGALVDASIMCNTFIHRLAVRLPINITNEDALHLMHEMMSRFRLNSTLNLTSLRCMFRIGLQEMRESGKKYNRYTEFAFFCLNAAVNMCTDSDYPPDLKRTQLKLLWNALVSVTFIDDFLLLTELRQYDQLNDCHMVLMQPIHVILRDALISDGTWNETKLMVISRHQHLLFDFSTIINFAMHKSSAFGITQLVDFIYAQKLMDWAQIANAARTMLMTSPNAILHAINHYVHQQMMHDFMVINDHYLLTN